MMGIGWLEGNAYWCDTVESASACDTEWCSNRESRRIQATRDAPC